MLKPTPFLENGNMRPGKRRGALGLLLSAELLRVVRPRTGCALAISDLVQYSVDLAPRLLTISIWPGFWSKLLQPLAHERAWCLWPFPFDCGPIALRDARQRIFQPGCWVGFSLPHSADRLPVIWCLASRPLIRFYCHCGCSRRLGPLRKGRAEPLSGSAPGSKVLAFEGCLRQDATSRVPEAIIAASS